MATIALLHGINQQHRSADELEAEWIPAIAGGVRKAGFPDIADDIRSRTIETRMGFYGYRFRKLEVQGSGFEEASIGGRELTEQLALEWLRRLEASPNERIRRAAQRELVAFSQHELPRQGLGNTARAATRALVRVPVLADLGMRFAEQFLWIALGQVTAYFEKPGLRDAIYKDTSSVLREDTAILMGHSLGSVVAFEAAHKVRSDLRLMITMGSPIGLSNVVFERLLPTPPSFPSTVQNWCNVADRDDFVAAVSDLSCLISRPSGAKHVFTNHLVSNGARPHDVKPYLNSSIVGAAIGECLRSL
jgi:hypothetical protein